MDFLYFPENKAEYIPGFIWFGIVLVASILTTYLLIKYSKTNVDQPDLEEDPKKDTDINKKDR